MVNDLVDTKERPPGVGVCLPIGEGGGGIRYHSSPQSLPIFHFFIFSYF
jgi:hypothetical protein